MGTEQRDARRDRQTMRPQRPGSQAHECQHQDVDLIQVPGTGTVYTYTVARHAVVPDLAGSIPYAVVVIEVDEAPGVRMIANIVESDPDLVRIGSRVEVVWDDVDDQVTIPRFKLVS